MTELQGDSRAFLQTLIDAALQAADPAEAVRRQLRREGRRLLVGSYGYNLDRGRIFLLAAGKAALAMGKAALEILKQDVWAGVIITKQINPGNARRYVADAGERYNNLAVFEAGHPVSDMGGLRATTSAVELLQETRAGDLLLCLISGGASALLTKPFIPLAEWQHLIQVLLESGCTINELNCVRKQLDSVKGGGLAEIAAPAATISLILSDVVGNPLDMIASGPTYPNPQSPGDALTVLHRYNVMQRVTPETWSVITQQLTDPRRATSLARFENLEVKNMIIGDVRGAANAATTAARRSGYRATMLTAYLQGEAREVGRVAAALGKEVGRGEILLLGGETTVTVRGDGSGGRNQELALAAALGISGCGDRLIATFATDGEDGLTDAAGAVVTGDTVPLARAEGLEPEEFLENNDSHTFFNRLAETTGHDCLLRPGPTGTNVNDLLFILRPL